jgi:hypothetical protein
MNRWLVRVVSTAALMCASASSAFATTVIPSTLAELVDEAHVIVRAHVAYVDDRAGESSGAFRTRIGFEVAETVKGEAAETIETVVPGGSVGAYSSYIPGLPRFTPGQEVVIMIEHTPGGDTFAGLAQGVFTVDRLNGQALVRRDMSELHFVGKVPIERLNGTKLGSLMMRMRAMAGGVR